MVLCVHLVIVNPDRPAHCTLDLTSRLHHFLCCPNKRVQGATRSLVTPLSKGCDWGQDVPSLLVAAAAAATKDGSEGGRGGGGVVLVEQQQQRLLAGTLVSIRATKRVAAAG